MGMNLNSACHKHKVQVMHFRGEEHVTLMPFYRKHRECLESDPTTSVETLEDQEQERDWMASHEDGGYETDLEVSHPFLQKIYADQAARSAKEEDK